MLYQSLSVIQGRFFWLRDDRAKGVPFGLSVALRANILKSLNYGGAGDGLVETVTMKIGYARISTEDQSLDLQRRALNDAGCAVFFEDMGLSGALASRPGLDQALNRLEAGDVLVVWKLDRLGRSLRHLVNLLEKLERRGVGFVSLTEAIDTTTPGGRLVFHVMAALGEFERSLIAERTRAGMQAAKARGVHVGRPRKRASEAA